jgi:hypothetical protein
MAELAEEVEIERGVAASLPSNGRKRHTLPPPMGRGEGPLTTQLLPICAR